MINALDLLALFVGVAWFAIVTITVAFSPLWGDGLRMRIAVILTSAAAFFYGWARVGGLIG